MEDYKITTISLDKENHEWLKAVNEKLEKKLKLGIGVSKIVNIICEMIREDKSGELEKQVLNETKVELKTKAFNEYVEKTKGVDKLNV
jgi:uncharacterized membrane-anchored protein